MLLNKAIRLPLLLIPSWAEQLLIPSWAGPGPGPGPGPAPCAGPSETNPGPSAVPPGPVGPRTRMVLVGMFGSDFGCRCLGQPELWEAHQRTPFCFFFHRSVLLEDSMPFIFTFLLPFLCFLFVCAGLCLLCAAVVCNMPRNSTLPPCPVRPHSS